MSKFFPFTVWGGPQPKILFFQSEHVSSQIWCQKFFPLLGWGSLDKKLSIPFTVWGGPQPKILFFQSEHVSSQIWCKKFFPLPVGGMGSLNKKIFFQSEHVSSQIWCQNFFPLPYGGALNQKFCFSSLNMYLAKSGVKNFSLYWDGGPLTKNCQFPLPYGGGVPWLKIFFFSLNMYQAKSGVKIFSLYRWGGRGRVPLQKKFFPVWTYIKPNLVSKIFPFTGGGVGSLNKNFFCQSEHVSSQIWCQNFFSLPVVVGGGGPSTKIFFSSLNMYEAKSAVKNFSLYWDWVPPPPPRCGLTHKVKI